MFISLRLCAIPVILTSALAACGGGAGGGGGGDGLQQPPAEVAFSSFAAVRPNQTVVMSGISQTGSGTDSAFTLDPVDSSSSTARLTFDGARNLSRLSFSTPGSTVTYGPNDVIRCEGFGCGAANETSLASVLHPDALGWNYQSFGVWMDHISPTTFQAGAMSAGAATPGSAVPTTSTATFTGHAGGFYFDGTGGRYATDAQMKAVTNFSSRSIQFSTTGTVLTDMNAIHEPAAANPGLNLSGTLNYAAGSSRFTGDVQTQSLGLTGSATGQFYGPSAQEIGGTYGLGSSDGKRMVGGFGGKR